MMFNVPLGNDDSISRSFDVTISNLLFDFDDFFTLRIDNKIFDDDFEDLYSLDPTKSTPLINKSILLVTPLPDAKQNCLRGLERFDPFFSLTQSSEMTRMMETPFDRFPHLRLPRQVAYSPKVVMYRYFHPNLILSDGCDLRLSITERTLLVALWWWGSGDAVGVTMMMYGGDDDGGVAGLSWVNSRREGEMARVRASGYGDRVDRVTRSHFGVRRKNPPENFSGGGAVVAQRWPEILERESELSSASVLCDSASSVMLCTFDSRRE
ncbi:hypothetical protein Tco_0204612 [Tanacetum coccineum]